MTGYQQPSSLAAALQCVDAGPSTILAGGTHVFAQGAAAQDETIVDISGLAALQGIVQAADHYRIGALTPWNDIRKADLPAHLTALRQASARIGTPQVQRMGTIGGNVCTASAAADGIPPLLILDASVVLESSHGTRQIPLEQFILGNGRTALQPGEILSTILIPTPRSSARTHFAKLALRRFRAIAVVNVAALIAVDDRGRIEEARVAVGACAEKAIRLTSLEARLIGERTDVDLDTLATDGDFARLRPIDDVRATAEYRAGAARTLVIRVLGELLEHDKPSDLQQRRDDTKDGRWLGSPST